MKYNCFNRTIQATTAALLTLNSGQAYCQEIVSVYDQNGSELSDLSHEDFSFLLSQDPEIARKIQITFADQYGITSTFQLHPSGVLPASLQARYPEIQSFMLVDLNTGALQGTMTVSPETTYGYIESESMMMGFESDLRHPGLVIKQEDEHSTSLSTQDFICNTEHSVDSENSAPRFQSLDERLFEGQSTVVGGDLATIRTLRLAMSMEAELTQSLGGTVSGGLAYAVEVVNRLNLVYGEFGVRFELIANNDLLIYLDPATDPFSGTTLNWLSQNQTSVDTTIGTANYDIGHVIGLNSDNSGWASIGSVCSSTRKARGGSSRIFSASPPPVGSFTRFTMPHEMGHQMGGAHTQFGTGGSGQVEPKLTMMSQGPDPFRGYYFHGYSVLQFTNNGNCAVSTTGTNTRPEISVPTLSSEALHVPIGTPYELDFDVIDADGDTIYYSWDSFNDQHFGEVVAIRPRPPVLQSSRSIPDYEVVYAGRLTEHERYFQPGDGVQNLRLFVRDSNLAGGGMVWTDEIPFIVDDTTGPFRVSSPAGGSEITTSTLNVTWDVAGTTGASIGASTVDISLSEDGGKTYPHTLASATANDGSETITLPVISTNAARIKIQPVDRLFYAVNDGPFTIGLDQIDIAHDSLNGVLVGTGITISATLSDPNSVLDSQGLRLHRRLGRDFTGDYQEYSMAEVSPGVWKATISSPIDCDADIEYYFSAVSTSGEITYEPSGAPWSSFILTPRGADTQEDFQTPTGWTTSSTASAGAWVATNPAGTPGDRSPQSDWDHSGNAFITGAGVNEDVDGGSVVLESPVQSEFSRVRFAYWLADTAGLPLDSGDGLKVEAQLVLTGTSNVAWVELETLTETSSQWRVFDSAETQSTANTDSDLFHYQAIRITATDSGSDSMLEAAIDSIQFTDGRSDCGGLDCPIDYSTPYNWLDTNDLLEFLDLYASSDPAADLAAPFGVFDFFDVSKFLELFNTGCTP